jgi:hypothetical protein
MKIFTLSLLLCLFTTFNLSAQWVRQDTPQNIAFINSVNFTGINSGIITGWQNDFTSPTTARAFFTTNAGTTWQNASVPESSRVIVSTEYINAQTFYGVGAMNHFFDAQKMSPSDFENTGIPKIYSRGEEVYFTGAFFKSTNAGASWFKYGALPEGCSYLTYFDFVNENTGMAIGQVDDTAFAFQSNIMKTTNGGLTWIPMINDGGIRQLGSVYMVNENIAIATGYEFRNGTSLEAVILRTTNGGLTWEADYEKDISYGRVFFSNNNTGYYAANNFDGGMIFRTSNAGATWHNVYFGDSLIIEGISFIPDGTTGIAYGEKFYTGKNYLPFALRTTNNGFTWVYQSIQENDFMPTLAAGCMIDKYNYYIAGGAQESAILYKTNNGGSTSVNNNSGITLSEYSLSQNFPNPFNPVTSIKYNVPNKSFVVMKVYNSLGKEIIELVNEVKTGGLYEVKFDASNLPSGVYYYKLTSENYSETKKMILIK